MNKLVIGVMGSADGSDDESIAGKARRLGRAVAEAGCSLITGACPGLPHQAVLGAGERGGLVVGVSPALSASEHVGRYASPVEGYDVIVYTGSGLMGREVVAIRSSDMIVVIGGHSGTLGEFAIAYDEGRLIGVLTGTGGIADAVAELVPRIDKRTGAVVLFDDEPERLIDRLVTYYEDEHHRRPSCFVDGSPGAVPDPPMKELQSVAGVMDVDPDGTLELHRHPRAAHHMWMLDGHATVLGSGSGPAPISTSLRAWNTASPTPGPRGAASSTCTSRNRSSETCPTSGFPTVTASSPSPWPYR